MVLGGNEKKVVGLLGIILIGAISTQCSTDTSNVFNVALSGGTLNLSAIG